MAGYVDGFVLPMPKKNVANYMKLAKRIGKIWIDHGALDYRECVGDDMVPFCGPGFPKQLKLRKTETVVFAYVRYKSRAHRDKVNALVMNDKRMAQMGGPKEMGFDPKRALCAGFELLVSASARRGRA